ncbi:Hypp1213 [Branchiostoma lanceolatum]|uniref:Hypp1213 protein n=1 Tax=Branchiostoma lanceolatum TaxID=7740 RepID=A0A8J9ZHA9_BRALA|nr:Hypp1213 [Branchiostoma lanceolatum]
MAMWMLSVFIIFCLAGSFQCQATITLKRISSVYLPYSLDQDGQAEFAMGDRGAVEKFSYDSEQYRVYAAGKAGILNVIDISAPSTPRVLHRQKLPGEAIAIDLCGAHLAVTLTGQSYVDSGKVLVFRKYIDGQTSMEPVQDMPVGTRPDSVKFTKDCRRLVVGNEAPAGEDLSGNFVDPEGSVMVIDFGSEDIGSVIDPDVRTADFRKFDALGEFYQSFGVRWLLKDLTVSSSTQTIPSIFTNSSFYQTLEPESITLNEDESKAYICLQTNNAIAVLDMATATFDNLYPLGTKYWGVSSLDASDDDGGIRFQNWPIYGLRQPDAISYFLHGDTGYIVTADEGSSTKVSLQGVEYDEQLKGEDIDEMDLLSSSFSSERLKEAISKDKELGCLRFSSVDGLDPTEPSKLYRLHTFGGRGVSIFRADDMSLVWDSGDDLERMEAKFYPEIFNSRYNDRGDERPTDQFDDRSCKRGTEPQSLTVGRLGNSTILFVAAQKTGSVFIYSLDAGEGITPTFQSVYWGGRADLTWEEAYQARQVGDTDVEDMSFVPGDKSPNGKPLLLVGGTSSGTVSIYEVMESAVTAKATTTGTTDLYLSLTTILCLLVIRG